MSPQGVVEPVLSDDLGDARVPPRLSHPPLRPKWRVSTVLKILRHIILKVTHLETDPRFAAWCSPGPAGASVRVDLHEHEPPPPACRSDRPSANCGTVSRANWQGASIVLSAHAAAPSTPGRPSRRDWVAAGGRISDNAAWRSSAATSAPGGTPRADDDLACSIRTVPGADAEFFAFGRVV